MIESDQLTHSETVGAIAGALMGFHSTVPAINKNAENPFYRSKYADLPAILKAIKDPLQSAGLAFAQFAVGRDGLTTVILHPESGEWFKSTFEMKPAKDDPQGRGSALTYQRRYALCAALGLDTDEDDDGNAASRQDAPKQQDPTLVFFGDVKAALNAAKSMDELKAAWGLTHRKMCQLGKYREEAETLKEKRKAALSER